MSELARLFAALALWGVTVLACAVVSGREQLRARAPIIALAALVAPLLIAPTWIVARGFAAMFGTVTFGRSLDLARRPGGLSFWRRVWMLVALFDVREALRCGPALDLREALYLAVHLGLCRLAWVGVFELAPGLDGVLAWALRWAAGLVLCYASFESAHSSLLILYRGVGFVLPRINDYPIRSTTLVEFWGRRWNRAVSGWLRDNLFFPLARRRHATLGLLAAFVGSTALHFWFAWVPLDLLAGAMMASFFMVHAAALLLERKLGVARWRVGARRVWTALWIAAPSPLFVEPALRLFAGLIR